MKTLIEVVGAILVDENYHIFCAQRKNKGELALKWEFPGGKIELGETPEQALYRELKEELDVDIKDVFHFQTVYHEYLTFSIKLHTYIAKQKRLPYILNDHNDAKWIEIDKLLDLDWAEADFPVVKKLMGSDLFEVFRSFPK